MLAPAVAVTVAVLLLVFLWRVGREGRRRFEYWKGVYGVWRHNRD